MKTIQFPGLMNSQAKLLQIQAMGARTELGTTKAPVYQKPKDLLRGSEGTPKCCYCKSEEDEDIDHFFLSCGKFHEIRESLLLQLKENLEALGDRGVQAWDAFNQGSATIRSQIVLGLFSFGSHVDEVVGQFREQFVAGAWNERIVI
ncbi:predicted protein [Nematostella vectensis]|uniref:Reverse transcriptase zinc-binding domain-containing protein n=1 Tax=Nematostella vectensis TaxID=45351 RepID=A7RFH0_NEMVE|nr:uncharacterized protein LOC5521904 [Nematostella vectensis]EDO49601.1 predicted protein [Nematostella vectensis]|eukprot:XP_001641664.1 predicted protein [Nematostella vectensis]